MVVVMVFVLIFAFGLLVVRWLIKSLIVKAACNTGSNWDFKTAASITGYAYLAEVVTSLFGLLISWIFIPQIEINVTNAEAARQAIADFQAQLSSTRFWYSLPISLLGLAWKSYLGGLGAYFGTRNKCSVSLGFTVFFCLGLISLLISFILSV